VKRVERFPIRVEHYTGNMWPVVAPQRAIPNILITKDFISLFSWRWLMRIINLYGLMLAEQDRLPMRKYATTPN